MQDYMHFRRLIKHIGKRKNSALVIQWPAATYVGCCFNTNKSAQATNNKQPMLWAVASPSRSSNFLEAPEPQDSAWSLAVIIHKRFDGVWKNSSECFQYLGRAESKVSILHSPFSILLIPRISWELGMTGALGEFWLVPLTRKSLLSYFEYR